MEDGGASRGFGAPRPFAHKAEPGRRAGRAPTGGAAGRSGHGPIHMHEGGYQEPRKTAVLARFRADLALSAAHTELLDALGGDAATLEALGAIWQPDLAVLAVPVSMRSFDADERAVLATGQISGGGEHHRVAPVQPRTNGAPRGQQPSHGGRRESDDEEVLWATPGEDAAIGAFDENGIFVIPGEARARPLPPLERPVRRAPEPIAAVPSSSEDEAPPGVPAPLVTAATRWVYMDGEGTARGPFACAKMHAWHGRGFFADALLLRREQDTVFAPLSEWRKRVGVESGASPFAAGEAASAASSSATSPALSPTAKTKACANPSVAVHPGAVSAAVPTTSVGAAADRTEGGAPHFGSQPTPVNEEQLRFMLQLGLNTGRPVFGAVQPETVPRPMDDDQQRFLASLGGGVSVQQGDEQQQTPPAAQALDADQLSFLRAFGIGGLSLDTSALAATAPADPRPQTTARDAVSVSDSGFKTTESVSKGTGIASKGNGIASKGTGIASKTNDSRVGAPEGGKRNTDGKGTAKETKSIVKEGADLADSVVRPAPPPAVGWAKPASPSEASLAEILREQEARAQASQAAQRAAAPAAAPRSFADTLRRASTNASPPASARPAAPSDGFATVGSARVPSQPRNAQKGAPATAPKPGAPSTAPITDTRAWAADQLRALEGPLDVSMLTLILSEMRTPDDVRAFVDDNVRATALSRGVDVDGFVRAYVARRFGGAPSASAAEPAQRPRASEPAFQTVGRKPARK